MVRAVILILSMLGSILAQSGSPPDSPCPAVFRYSYSPSQGWHGVVAIVPPLTFSEVQLVLSLKVALYRPDSGVGKIDILGGATEVQNIANRASTSQRQTIQYLVVFPPYEEFPHISSVIINGNEFCPSPADYDGARGVIQLKYTLKTGLAVATSNGNEFSVSGAINTQPQQPTQQQWQTQQPTQQQWQQQQPQQPSRPDTIACVGDKHARQTTTGCPHHHGNTVSHATSRPKPISRPRPRPTPPPGAIVFPEPDAPTESAEDENVDPFRGLDSHEKKVLVNRVNFNIGSITQGGSVNISNIEKHLETLVSLLQPISKSAMRDTLKRKGNKKGHVEEDDDDDHSGGGDDNGDKN